VATWPANPQSQPRGFQEWRLSEAWSDVQHPSSQRYRLAPRRDWRLTKDSLKAWGRVSGRAKIGWCGAGGSPARPDASHEPIHGTATGYTAAHRTESPRLTKERHIATKSPRPTTQRYAISLEHRSKKNRRPRRNKNRNKTGGSAQHQDDRQASSVDTIHQVPTTPPSIRLITTVAARGRPPDASGHFENASGSTAGSTAGLRGWLPYSPGC